MPATKVSSADVSVLMTTVLLPVFMVPALTWSPDDLRTGTLSPVSMLSSNAEMPVTTTPSRGDFSPALISTLEPMGTADASTSRPESARTAVSGRRDSTDEIASRAWPVHLDSRKSATENSTTTVPASVYSAIAMAPATASVIRKWMSRMPWRSAPSALRTIPGRGMATAPRATYLKYSSHGALSGPLR